MPIVDKINALTGKTAETIEDAIANIDIGGSSNVEIMRIELKTGEKFGEYSVVNCSMTFAEAESVLDSGKILYVLAYDDTGFPPIPIPCVELVSFDEEDNLSTFISGKFLGYPMDGAALDIFFEYHEEDPSPLFSMQVSNNGPRVVHARVTGSLSDPVVADSIDADINEMRMAILSGEVCFAMIIVNVIDHNAFYVTAPLNYFTYGKSSSAPSYYSLVAEGVLYGLDVTGFKFTWTFSFDDESQEASFEFFTGEETQPGV